MAGFVAKFNLMWVALGDNGGWWWSARRGHRPEYDFQPLLLHAGREDYVPESQRRCRYFRQPVGAWSGCCLCNSVAAAVRGHGPSQSTDQHMETVSVINAGHYANSDGGETDSNRTIMEMSTSTSSAPAATVDVLASLLESTVNSVFRFMGEGSPYLSRATAEVRKPLQEMVLANHRRAAELAAMLDALGAPTTVQVSPQNNEQYLAFLSLNFLLPKLVEEKKICLARYANALSRGRHAAADAAGRASSSHGPPRRATTRVGRPGTCRRACRREQREEITRSSGRGFLNIVSQMASAVSAMSSIFLNSKTRPRRPYMHRD